MPELRNWKIPKIIVSQYSAVLPGQIVWLFTWDLHLRHLSTSRGHFPQSSNAASVKHSSSLLDSPVQKHVKITYSLISLAK